MSVARKPLQEKSANVPLQARAPTEADETQIGPSAPGNSSSAEIGKPSKPLTQDELVEHREIYRRLRRELSRDDLSKFEIYVRRYDLLEIPLDGPRGLLIRVKKLLLLSDSTLRQQPARLRLRKDLAREFERVCKSVHG